jgi:hypothetical protein
MNTKQYRLYTPDSFLQATPLAGSGSDENLAPDQKVYHPIGQTPPTNPKRLILILTQTYEKRISTLFPVISIPQDMHNFNQPDQEVSHTIRQFTSTNHVRHILILMQTYEIRISAKLQFKPQQLSSTNSGTMTKT